MPQKGGGMDKKILKLLVMSLIGLISAQTSHAKSYYHRDSVAEKVVMLQDRFDVLCEKIGSLGCGNFIGDPRIIGYQGYRLWPTQRRKLMHVELNAIKEIFLSFPPACVKNEAIKNLEKRMSLLRQ